MKLKMIVEMENYKFEVKRVTHLKVIAPKSNYFVILHLSIFLGIVLLLFSEAIFGFKY